MAQEMIALSAPRRGAAEWRALVKAYGRRTVTRREFCREHGVAESTLDWWRRKLERGDADRPARPPVRIEPAVLPLSFIEIAPPPGTAPAWDVELDLGQGMVLRLRRS